MALTLANGLGVDDVFRFVQFVANKESRGWISPEEFLIAAEVAQLSLYSELEALYAQTKTVHASLRPFVAFTSTLTEAAGTLPVGFRIPIVASIVSGGGVVGSEVREIEIAELPNIIISSIVAPSVSYPIYYINGEAGVVHILPDTVTMKINYLKAPIPPVWAYTIVSGRPVYDSVNSTNFGFDPSLFTEISMRILANIGINIGKEEITQYAIGIKQKA